MSASASPTNPKRYQVLPFTRDALVTLFSGTEIIGQRELVDDKRQIDYLEQYCVDLDVKRLVFEPEYIDRHFGEDFNGYYVRCHQGYKKKCGRIHFFCKEFDEDALSQLILNGSGSNPDLGYCGFSVVKPLPQTVIGRTCLALRAGLPPLSTLRSYVPNLFGMELQIDSLPFQEQDHEVGACATSALWTALHGTAGIFGNPILSPIEITKRAVASGPNAGPALPNDGLDTLQMTGVLHQLGLEVDLIDLNSLNSSAERLFLFHGAVYAYLKLGIPVVLGMDFNLTEIGPRKRHTVALTGIGPPSGNVIQYTRDNFSLRATRIKEFWAHDDGVGPFSPLSFVGNTDILLTAQTEYFNNKHAQLDCLLVPLYHQIRIKFRDVLNGVIEFEKICGIAQTELQLEKIGHLEWDIFLAEGKAFKKEIAASQAQSLEKREELLTHCLPRFLWRAIAFADGGPVFEILLDATDLRQGYQLITILFYDDTVKLKIASILNKTHTSGVKMRPLTRAIINFWKRHHPVS